MLCPSTTPRGTSVPAPCRESGREPTWKFDRSSGPIWSTFGIDVYVRSDITTYPEHTPVSALSLDHLVRLEEQRRRHREAKGLGGLEVDDQLELRGLLYRQVGGLGAFQDLIHVVGSAPKQLGNAH